MARPALLAVATVPLWPVHDGYSLRALHLVRALTADWDVTLVAPPHRGSPETVPEFGLASFVPAALTGRWTWLPSQYDTRPLVAAVAAARARTRFDAALLWSGAEFLAFEQPGFPAAIADRIDCMTMINWREVRAARGRTRLTALRAMLAFGRYERRLVRRLAATTVVGEDDARVLRRLAGRDSVHVVPNGVELQPFPPAASLAPVPTVVCSGVMNYGPNVSAATHFARDVWPLVRRAVPAARFRIVGRKPSEAVCALAELPGVEVTGAVPDMAAELRGAWVAAATMLTGGGIKNKVLEAWAVGTPVVMTSVAANGLVLDAPARALVADEPAALAERVIALLSDPVARARAARAAHALAEREHGWADQARRLTRLLHAVRAAGGTTPTGSPEVPVLAGT